MRPLLLPSSRAAQATPPRMTPGTVAAGYATHTTLRAELRRNGPEAIYRSRPARDEGSTWQSQFSRLSLAARRKRRTGFRRKRPSPRAVSAIRLQSSLAALGLPQRQRHVQHQPASGLVPHAQTCMASPRLCRREGRKGTPGTDRGGFKSVSQFSGGGAQASRRASLLGALRARFARPFARSLALLGLRPRLRPLSVTPSCNAPKPRQKTACPPFRESPPDPPPGCG
jgi:hypothetical protein